jgi:hypothetical protein
LHADRRENLHRADWLRIEGALRRVDNGEMNVKGDLLNAPAANGWIR